MKVLIFFISFLSVQAFGQQIELRAKVEENKLLFSLEQYRAGGKASFKDVDFGELSTGLQIKSKTVEKDGKIMSSPLK